jgi:hypothetical protein
VGTLDALVDRLGQAEIIGGECNGLHAMAHGAASGIAEP